MRKFLPISLLALLLPLAAAAQHADTPAAGAAPRAAAVQQVPMPRLPGRSSFPRFWNDYRPLPPLSLPGENPAVLNRAELSGKLPLSLRQAVQLTLADDLNLLADNYERVKAQIDVLRTQSGGAARGISGAAISTSLFGGAIGAGVGGGGGNGNSNGGGFFGGGNLYIPGGGSYDPQLSLTTYSIHSRTPLNSPILYGIPVDVENDQAMNFSYNQAFPTGTSIGIGVFGARSFLNTNALTYNPFVSTTLSIGFWQPLLKGFGAAANRGFMQTASNDTNIAGAVFRQKVMQRATAAADRYWKLAEAQRLATLAQAATTSTSQLAADTRQLVTAGRKPEADLIEVESQLAGARQAELSAETHASTRAMALALRLSRRVSPALLTARIEVLSALPRRTPFTPPTSGDPAPPPPTLAQEVAWALASSPTLAQARFRLANAGIAVASTRNALLPSLGVGGSWASYGLSGMRLACQLQQFPCPAADQLPSQPGGFVQALTQSLHSSYPDYGVAVQLSFHLFNRQARADHARAMVDQSQQRLRYRALANQVAQKTAAAYIGWQNAAAALLQTQAQFHFARRTYLNTRYKYRYGRATMLDVLAAGKAANQAAVTDATARLAYALAEDKLDRRTGRILARFRVRIRALPRATQLGG